MSNLQIIARLSDMLQQALAIIKRQAELLEMHGIHTDSGHLEEQRTALLEDIEKSI